MRHCVLGEWERDSGRRKIVVLEEPLTESLADADDHAIHALHLDGAIRALPPAAMADICVSKRARDLLMVLLGAQRRSLLSSQQADPDHRGTHAVVSARALLTVAEHGDDAAIYEHIDAYADNSALLGTFLRALSAAAEETPSRAATARRIWPSVVRHVFALNDSGHKPFGDRHFGDSAVASLIPNPAGKGAYYYPELHGPPIEWWDPHAMLPEVDEWLVAARGRAYCVDHLIRFVGVLAPEDQVRTGFPWVSMLVLAAPSPHRRPFLSAAILADRDTPGRRGRRRLGRLAESRGCPGCRGRCATGALLRLAWLVHRCTGAKLSGAPRSRPDLYSARPTTAAVALISQHTFSPRRSEVLDHQRTRL